MVTKEGVSGMKPFIFGATIIIEFSLNIVIEFDEFSDKNIIFKKIFRTWHLLC